MERGERKKWQKNGKGYKKRNFFLFNGKSKRENYNGISLVFHYSKKYKWILERRLRGRVENKLNKAQHGFGPGRGTIVPIFSLKMLIEKNWDWAGETYVGLIDWGKAFYSVPREKLWETLSDNYYEISLMLVKIIRNMYMRSERAARMA